MKILHIYKNYFPVLGGIENHIKLVCEELAKFPGYQVQVVVTNGNSHTKREILNGVEVIKCGRLFEFASTPVSFSMYNQLKDLKPDVVHFHFPYPPGEIFGWRHYRNLSTKFVMNYHSDVVRQAAIMRLYNPLFRKVLGRVDTVVAASPNYAESSPILSTLPNDKLKIIPYCIRLDQFKKPDQKVLQPIREEYGDRIVSFVGKLRYYKGLHFLVKAAQKIRANILIIGEGPCGPSLQRQVKELGLERKIFFPGEVDNSSLVNYLYASDVFVLPSIYRSEAFGISMLEAMTCGLPVVCTELGTGTSFVNLHQQTGLVVRPMDSDALAEAINSLLDNPQLRESLGENAKRRVEQHFSLQQMMSKLLEVYQS